MQGNRFQILSLDGGGLKGLFTASFLAQWEKERSTRVADHFDLITGTSTGGIIALGLGLGFSAEEIMNLYIDKADQIFPSQFLGSIKHVAGVKYKSDGLKNALTELMGDRLLGHSKKRLLIPAFNPKFNDIYIYKTCHAERLLTDYKVPAVTVAMATSAAPTYFSPALSDSGLELVDGGVWANNPVMLGIAEALGYLKIPQTHIAALRIGTTQEVLSIDKVRTEGGLALMAKPVINFMMRGQSLSASGMAQHILGKERYFEIDPEVAQGDFHLDKLRRELLPLAETRWRKASSELFDRGFFEHQAAPFEPCHRLS